MNNSGWIKLHRKIEDWSWYQDVNTKSLFLHLLLKANIQDKKWKGILIKRGQIIIGIENFGKGCGLTRQQTRTSLDKLKSTNEVTIKTTNKYTEVTINKYNDYQKVTSNITNEQPTSNHQVTTTKEYKEYKKIRSNTKKEKFLDPLTEQEYWEIAKKRRVLVDDVKEMEETVMNSISNGRDVINLRATIQQWLINGIQNGRIEQLGQLEMDSQANTYDPEKRKRNELFIKKMDESGKPLFNFSKKVS